MSTTGVTQAVTSVVDVSTQAVTSSTVDESTLQPTTTMAAQCTTTPPTVPNGRYDVTSTGPPYQDNSRTVYSCNSGFIMSGPANSMQCSNGNWIGTVPACTAVVSNYEILIWVLVGVGSLVVLLLLIFLIVACLYCCTRNRPSVVQVQPASGQQNQPGTPRTTQSKKAVNNAGPTPGGVTRVKSASTQMYDWEGASVKYANGKVHEPALSRLSNGSKANNEKADLRTPPKWMPHAKVDRNIDK